MKLSIGKADYEFRQAIRGAALAGQRGKDMKLILLDMKAMREVRGRLPHVRGVPIYVAFDEEGEKLWVHPAPKGEYELLLDRIPLAPPKDPPGKLNDPVVQPVKVAGTGHTLTLPKRG